ncbi:MAG TPA: molybdenum cofactor guanylyltransferase [Pyrinomonadaceae bacterium]
MVDIDTYILIGGRSRRLGRDKATVDLGGQTLAQRAFQTVTEALPDSRITFVAGNQAQFAIEAILADAGFIFDLVADRGPLGGLHSALADATAPWIFVLACDYPFMSSEMIRLLAENVSNDYGAVVPEQPDGRLQPLCACYSVEKASLLVQQIIDKPRVPPPLHEIVGELNPKIIEPVEFAHLSGSEDFFTNVNTAADLDLAGEIERKLSVEK